MPTSAPGTSRRAGFTLIELLVVLLIMGLGAGLIAALSQPDERMLLRVEAERLAQLLDLAGVEARLTGKRIVWTSDGAQYRFARWREESGWAEVTDEALRARRLPTGMAISGLRIEATPAAGATQIEFTPNAAVAFDFTMTLGAARTAIAASPLGEVRIHAAP